MKNHRIFLSGIIVVILGSCGLLFDSAAAEQLFAPDFLWKRNIAEKHKPKEIADTYLGIRYRADGTIDERGYFTTFNHPDQAYEQPGLNCSGLLVSASRFIFNKNFTLDEVSRDRQGNSGKDSPYGEDWDFGWDLILNLTEGVPRQVLMPDGKPRDLHRNDGNSLRGFDLHDHDAWQRVLAQMQPGRIYFGSISRDRGQSALHYHVVMIVPDEKGNAWLYHATRRSHVHRMNLKSPRGLNRLMAQFRPRGGSRKDILLIEALLPGDEPRPRTAGNDGAGNTPSPSPFTRFAAAESSALDDAARAEATNAVESGNNDPTGSAGEPNSPAAKQPQSDPGPELEIKHIAGKVFQQRDDLVTHLPKFWDKEKKSIALWFRNRGGEERSLEVVVKGPDGETKYTGTLPSGLVDLQLAYPGDFGKPASGPLPKGRYGVYAFVDGEQWVTNVFEIAQPREAEPKIVEVSAPTTVSSGKTFTVTVKAENHGAESDYGGITLSSPDPSGLSLVSAKPGKVYGRGSTVLSITQDKIRTKVPMAENWIELWGENEVHEMKVGIKAGKPGEYPLYVRAALRGVNVKSNVVLMDPKESKTVDQQGFPVYVTMIKVR